MFDEKKLIEAVEVIRNYCHNNRCEICLFRMMGKSCMFNAKENVYPGNWNLELAKRRVE